MMVFQQDNLGISIPKLGPLSSVFVIVGLRAREQMISTWRSKKNEGRCECVKVAHYSYTDLYRDWYKRKEIAKLFDIRYLKQTGQWWGRDDIEEEA